MRHHVERFVILPISIGCVSQSSVAVCDSQPRMTHTEYNPSPRGLSSTTEVLAFESLMDEGKAAKPAPLCLLAVPRSNMSAGLQRLIKSFKGLSQLFTNYKSEEEDEEMEMEIGFPTDVKHVAHIGWDGAGSGGGGWDVTGCPDLLALPSVSLVRQFEAAMASPHLRPTATSSYLAS
ncbi:hypothetical protein Taro_016047 [Colocasia esculenta]|uniref:CRIB domain-containing protein n=1 Tax=Colocasia esculenta TaxID=4460 RepID=A0A843UP50_COLES|nr:hypothetical protein [Colocasia esculenta]